MSEDTEPRVFGTLGIDYYRENRGGHWRADVTVDEYGVPLRIATVHLPIKISGRGHEDERNPMSWVPIECERLASDPAALAHAVFASACERFTDEERGVFAKALREMLESDL